MNNLTIFADQYDINGVLKGIYIKEKINDSEYKIIIASEGNLIKSKNGYNFKLYDGKITNIDSKEILTWDLKKLFMSFQH